jgi:hypothetical protein
MLSTAWYKLVTQLLATLKMLCFDNNFVFFNKQYSSLKAHNLFNVHVTLNFYIKNLTKQNVYTCTILQTWYKQNYCTV